MPHDTWVKSYRKFRDWEWYKKPGMFRLFHHLIYGANHKPGKWQGLEIDRGQIVSGRNKLSEETGLSPQQIRTCLSRLQETGELTIKSTNQFSIITICNYDKYQPIDFDINQQVNQRSTSDQPAINHKQELKNDKNGKKSKGTNVPSNNNCPHNDIISIYHEVLPEFPKVVVWNDSHKSQLRTRWKENSDYQSLEWWKQFFDYIRQSDFLMGRSSTTSSWQPDLEWLTKKTNFAKIANGRYHRDAHPLKGKLSDAAIQTMRNLSEINYEE